MAAPTWQSIAVLAQSRRDASLAAVEPPVPSVPDPLPLNVTHLPRRLLNMTEISITETPPETLLASLASGALTSMAVTSAFLRRAGICAKLANCITELLPDRALARAAELDAHLASTGEPVGPLHGLPISVKEMVGMAGLGQNGGFVSWWDRVAESDALILQMLWGAGAVFYARTTEPQSLMHLECSSNLYGETVNPYNRALTSGGSTGGEGALLALRGSCLGIGTDIGGSIRNPASNCGVYGYKPTSYRLPLMGCAATMIGQEHIVPTIGPLSTSLEGCKVFMKTLVGQKPWLRCPDLLPFPWRDGTEWLKTVEGRKNVKIGVMWHDGVVKPHPPVTRALREMVEKLRKVDGVEVVDWKPWKHDYAWDILSSLYFADGGKEEAEAINASGEPWRPMSTFIIKEQKMVKELSMHELWRWTLQREIYRAQYAALWNSTGGDPVDVILCPAGPGAAPPLDHARYWGYTAQWNLLDYPAICFPVTKVDQEMDRVESGFRAMGEQDEWNWRLYRPERYVDAPVGLQLVGKRYEDEKVFEVLEWMERVVGLPFGEM